MFFQTIEELADLDYQSEFNNTTKQIWAEISNTGIYRISLPIKFKKICRSPNSPNSRILSNQSSMGSSLLIQIILSVSSSSRRLRTTADLTDL